MLYSSDGADQTKTRKKEECHLAYNRTRRAKLEQDEKRFQQNLGMTGVVKPDVSPPKEDAPAPAASSSGSAPKPKPASPKKLALDEQRFADDLTHPTKRPGSKKFELEERRFTQDYTHKTPKAHSAWGLPAEDMSGSYAASHHPASAGGMNGPYDPSTGGYTLRGEQTYGVPESRAEDSKLLQPPDIQQLGKALHVPVEYSNGVVGSGMYYNGRVRISPKSTTPVLDILYNNLSRRTQQNPTDYDAFAKKLTSSNFYVSELHRRGFTPESFEKIILREHQNKDGISLPSEQVTYEAAARFVKEVLFSDAQAAERLKRQNPELYAYIKDYAQTVDNCLGSSSQNLGAESFTSIYLAAGGGGSSRGGGAGRDVPWPRSDTRENETQHNDPPFVPGGKRTGGGGSSRGGGAGRDVPWPRSDTRENETQHNDPPFVPGGKHTGDGGSSRGDGSHWDGAGGNSSEPHIFAKPEAIPNDPSEDEASKESESNNWFSVPFLVPSGGSTAGEIIAWLIDRLYNGDGGNDFSGAADNTEDQNDETSSNSKIESVNEFDTTTLTRSQQKAVHSIRQIINDHLTDKDLEGALRDLQGNPVPKGTTGYWDHVQEVKDAYTGLRRGKNSIEGSLKNPNLPKEHRIFLQEQLDIINQYIEKIAEIFEMYGGI